MNKFKFEPPQEHRRSLQQPKNDHVALMTTLDKCTRTALPTQKSSERTGSSCATRLRIAIRKCWRSSSSSPDSRVRITPCRNAAPADPPPQVRAAGQEQTQKLTIGTLQGNPRLANLHPRPKTHQPQQTLTKHTQSAIQAIDELRTSKKQPACQSLAVAFCLPPQHEQQLAALPRPAEAEVEPGSDRGAVELKRHQCQTGEIERNCEAPARVLKE